MKALTINQRLARGAKIMKEGLVRWVPRKGKHGSATIQVFVESVTVLVTDDDDTNAKWKLRILTGDDEDKGKSWGHNMLLDFDKEKCDEKTLLRKKKKIHTSGTNLAIFGMDIEKDGIDRDLIEEQAGSTLQITLWKPKSFTKDEKGEASKLYWLTAWPPVYMDEVIEGPQEEKEEEVDEEKPEKKKVTKKKAKAKVEEKKPEPEYEDEDEDDDDEYEEVE